MQHSLLPLLTAPEGGGALALTVLRQDDGDVIEGTLTDASGRVYPIEDGIPRLLPSALAAAQQSEMEARDSQVEQYDRMAFLKAFGGIEIPMTLLALGLGRADRLLEAGCGTGRMTQSFARSVADMVAIDFSFESLRVNRRKLAQAGVKNVHLIQADLCHLPLLTGGFSRVVSCQVLEHVPDDAMRRTAVAELARVAKSGATVVVSAYQHSVFTRAYAQKEGMHAGGIPYFRFNRDEFRSVLGSGLDVRSISGILVYLYLAQCKKK
jgi:ubiquinone/menaquinone biosynthesis C-methylase UbiE